MYANPIAINWHPELPLYASELFLKTVGDEYGWIGGFSESGRLKCILPYTIIRKFSIRMVRFRIETIPVETELTLQEEKEFLNSSISFFKKSGAGMIIPASTNAIFRTYPDHAIAVPYGTFIIDLSKPKDVLWGNMNSVYRKKIRNSIKSGVQILNGIEYLDIAYKVISETLNRSSLDFMNFKDFQRFVRGLNENVKIFVAESQGKIQGCTIFPFSPYAAYSLYGGRISDADSGAMNLLNWEAMIHFQALGIKRFDFMGVRINPEKGSKQEGIMIFKQRFGGQLIQGFMWKYALQPLHYLIYRLAVKLRRGGDIVDAERYKLKSFKTTE